MATTYYRAKVKTYMEMPDSWGSPMLEWMDKYVTAYRDAGGGWHIIEDPGWIWSAENFIILGPLTNGNDPNFLFKEKKANGSSERKRKT